jgi:hypothetical protein
MTKETAEKLQMFNLIGTPFIFLIIFLTICIVFMSITGVSIFSTPYGSVLELMIGVVVGLSLILSIYIDNRLNGIIWPELFSYNTVLNNTVSNNVIQGEIINEEYVGEKESNEVSNRFEILDI